MTGLSFFAMIAWFTFLLVGALGVERVGLEHARWMFAIVLSGVPAFAVHGAETSFLDAYAQHRFTLPPWAASVPAARHTVNPRITSLWISAALGLPIAAGAYWWISQRWPQAGLSRTSFIVFLSGCSGVIAALVMFARTGRTFVREASVTPEHRRFAGTIDQYLWQRHGWPEFLIGVWFNGWASLAIAHGPLTDAGSGLSRGELLTDALMTGCCLALFIAGENRNYATFALRWGVVSPLRERASSGWRFTARLLGAVLGGWLALAALLFACGIEHVGTVVLIALRALWFGAIAGASAYATARWTFATAEAQPAAPSAARL